jgi:hypothetical protein
MFTNFNCVPKKNGMITVRKMKDLQIFLEALQGFIKTKDG